MEIKYTTVRLDDSQDIGYNSQDINLAGEYTVFTRFNPDTDFILSTLSVNNEVIFSNPDYRGYSTVQDGEYTINEGVSRIRINPELDVKRLEYMVPEIIVGYTFYRNLFRTVNDRFESLYIDSISDDRTEVKMYSLDIESSEVLSKVNSIVDRLNSESTFSDFKLLFGDGHTELAVNIDSVQEQDRVAVLVKLYSPLPSSITLKTELHAVEEVSSPLKYSVTTEVIIPPVSYQKLSGPNFNNGEVNQESATEYLSSVDLIDVDTYSTDILEIISKTSEKSATLGIDYSNLDNFIHYSSATERLKNFVYKAQLIETYSSSLSNLPTGASINESKEFYRTRIQNIVRNFDHFERHLYFESGGVTWPKQNSTKPYTPYHSTSSVVVSWYSDYIDTCETYDNTNYFRLMGSLPEYLREDPDNENLVLFIDMLGQHFDNIKIYADTVSQKYDTDNRVDRGLATSLIEPVLENFGLKLYKNSFKDSQDLFKYFVLTDDKVNSEIINTTSSIPNINLSEENYRQQIYKRIYHNLPALLKTKGTQRSIKVLMTTFGIPSDMFPVKTYGGTSFKNKPYFGLELPLTGSLDKVRLDTTGSIEGNVLAPLASIQKREPEYQLDLHVLEVGPSPSDNINRYILENISSSFDIDTYLGDPRGYDKNGLNKIKEDLLLSLERYDLKDFIRLIRFYDNAFFRMVRDFAPGRDVVDSGIIIKPHILEHNLVKDFSIDSENLDSFLEVEIDTAFITGSDGGVFGASSDYITSYTETLQYPDGLTSKPKTQNGYTLVGRHDGETPRYTGELSGSVIKAVENELNIDNSFKKPEFFDSFYNVTPIVDISTLPTPPATTTTTTSTTTTTTSTPTTTTSTTENPVAINWQHSVINNDVAGYSEFTITYTPVGSITPTTLTNTISSLGSTINTGTVNVKLGTDVTVQIQGFAVYVSSILAAIDPDQSVTYSDGTSVASVTQTSITTGTSYEIDGFVQLENSVGGPPV